jgi:hypothetical protein|tara:strand:- start:14578 stop:15378 length:801 start_codon:yes stop_codon:yes gene_type:complete
MVSVLQVYNALKDLTNKEQKGFITPQVFNSFAALAQMNIYNELFTELVDAKRLGRQNFDPGRDKSVRKQRLEDLAFFARRSNLSSLVFDPEGLDAAPLVPEGVFKKPYNLSKIISLTTGSETSSAGDVTPRTSCEIIYDLEKMDRILGSNLSTPTDSFPVALIHGDAIEVFPDTVTDVEMTYYVKPTSYNSSNGSVDVLSSPKYAFKTFQFSNQDSDEFFDAENSKDFMLPPHYLSELVMELAKLLGVRLRDPNVQSFAIQEEASE